MILFYELSILSICSEIKSQRLANMHHEWHKQDPPLAQCRPDALAARLHQGGIVGNQVIDTLVQKDVVGSSQPGLHVTHPHSIDLELEGIASDDLVVRSDDGGEFNEEN